MIECGNGEIRDQLPDFVHDKLSASARAVVAAHVASCAACAAELALLRQLRGALRAGPAVDVARIVAALSRTGANDRRGRPARRQVGWRIAATIVALLAGGGSAAILGIRDRTGAPRGSQVMEQPSRDALPVEQVASADLSIDADLGDVSVAELEALLEELEAFDGLPAGEPEPTPASSTSGEEGL
jgi:anti-sigma factor RsiW